MTSLTDNRILIAGGTGNVGRHLVAAVLAAGGTAIVPSRTEAKFEALKREHAAHAGRLVPLMGDITDPQASADLVGRAGSIHGAVASLSPGSFIAAPSILKAPIADFRRALDGYLIAHFTVAQSVIPALERLGGGYVMIDGLLAFESYPGTGLVSAATAGQAMLARVLMQELAESRVRVNDLVLYSSFGRGQDDENVVTGADIGRYVAYLLSSRAADVRGQTIHLTSREQLAVLN
jgi:NAD(P)-dependent dehydrogenase (short-subunit alcohol dehydrogenase family)